MLTFPGRRKLLTRRREYSFSAHEVLKQRINELETTLLDAFETNRLHCKTQYSSNEAGFSQYKDQLLLSLNFGSPFTRVNHIPARSKGTFEWIFDAQASRLLEPVSHFREWLQGGTGVFWIRAKPGAGKSTFVKFLAGVDNENQRTLKYLKCWAAPKSPVLVSFYFWLADSSHVQNRLRGFLCHLLYQLISKTTAEFASSLVPMEQLRTKRSLDNWDLEELEELLKRVSRQVASDNPICFVIDALDECMEDDLARVVKVIEELISYPDVGIKFCLSSRPEQRIENWLRELKPSILELHKLTEDDIKKYVNYEFDHCSNRAAYLSNWEKQGIIDRLVGSSEGVFLWAFLVARNLRRCIERKDNVSMLQQELREMPKDMMELYETMLRKSGATGEHHKAEAASYFKFVIECGALRLRHYQTHTAHFLCSRPTLANFVCLYESFNKRSMTRFRSTTLRDVADRINDLCAGLVMVDEEARFSRGVDFFHRTARDFFREPIGMKILERCKFTQLQLCCLLVDSMCKYGHSRCRMEMRAYEATQMIGWLRCMSEVEAADQLKFLQHVNEEMSLAHIMNGGSQHENWVYDQVKSSLGYYDALDFTGLTLQVGTAVLLSHHLNMERNFSQRYKDYLLLCSCYGKAHRFNNTRTPWIRRLLELGANPNATFYWGVHDRLKLSPWLKYLADFGHREPVMDTLKTFLDGGARLDDRTVLLKSETLLLLDEDDCSSEHRGPSGFPAPTRVPHSYYCIFLAVEVNAKYLLKAICMPRGMSSHPEAAEILSRPEVQRTQAYRRILLVHPDYRGSRYHSPIKSNGAEKAEGKDKVGDSTIGVSEQGHHQSLTPEPDDFPAVRTTVLTGISHLRQFAEIDIQESEKLLENLEEFVTNTRDISLKAIAKRGHKKLQEVWERSPKVADLRRYLQEKGYYKEAEDPAVPQGPIPMFEESE
jgi:hypothetical protein